MLILSLLWKQKKHISERSKNPLYRILSKKALEL